MRSIFEKFDRIPIWVRIGVLLLLIAILITGLFFIKPNYKTSHQSSTVATYSRASSSKAGSSNENLLLIQIKRKLWIHKVLLMQKLL